MKKEIRVTPEVRDAIMAKYGVSRTTVWEALVFITRNKRGQNIRRDALAMGGRYIEEDFIPQCTFKRTSDGWIQQFAADVLVTVVGSDVVITKGRKTVAEFEDVTMSGYSNILAQAQKLAETGMLDMAS
ncbi:MAG: hypothetical protein IKL91_05455 [Bacteroidales bacterium]|nr:hypothetical protein [Bacteroidales bacterium]